MHHNITRLRVVSEYFLLVKRRDYSSFNINNIDNKIPIILESGITLFVTYER